MHEDLRAVIDQARQSRDVDQELVYRAVGVVMDGEASDAQIASLLTALAVKGEAISEVAGAARAMLERARAMPTSRSGLLDTCGTGGDQLSTFNISTAAAIVAAAAGTPVAKHGNRAVSSTSGSSDVLTALGVAIELEPEQAGRCVDDLGIGFCFAPLYHGAMRHAAGVRRELGFRTIFNLLGPLTNPAGARFQLLGANRVGTARLLAGALGRLGREGAVVVCGNDELDEVGLWGQTTALVVGSDEFSAVEHRWRAADFGLPECQVESLVVRSPGESAEVIRGVLAGQGGAARDIVLANTAAALWAAGACEQPGDGVAAAAAAIDEGRAADLLDQLAHLSQSLAEDSSD